jgi:Ca2+/Na+ antiporter
LEVVRRMLKHDFETYFTEWLPVRKNYGFPIRDLSLFIDHWLGGDNQAIFFISNFFYFVVSALLFFLTVSWLWPSSSYIPPLLVALYMIHPFQTEIIEWITCRKYLTGGIPIALGTYLVVKWRESGLNRQRISTLVALWILSLLSYPTAVFWIFWALFYPSRQWSIKTNGKQTLSLLGLAVFYLWVVGRNTGEINSSLVNIIPAFEKSFHFGYNALGRGFFNLVLPFWTFPYYREDHVFSFVGLGLLFLVSLGIYKFVFLKIKKPGFELARSHFRECSIWFCGGLLFFIPTANTILGFYDFMLADRHFYFSMPFFTVALGYFLMTLNELYTAHARALMKITQIAAAIWLGASVVAITNKSPLWHDDFILMKDCALNEKSPRCYSQTIRRRFFKSDCNGVKDIILLAADAYKTRPPYSYEYTSEVPFFHASCVALNLSTPKEKKVEIIEGLQEFYGPSPEIIFGIVLASLEMGQLDQAFNQANQYYLGGLPSGPISATRTLQSIYLGQISALCSLNPSPLCKERLERFKTLHGEAELANGAGSWGKEATLIMAKRGMLIQ